MTTYFTKNPTDAKPLGGLTRLMTALAARTIVKDDRLGDWYTVLPEDMEGSTDNTTIRIGDSVTLKSLFYLSLMLGRDEPTRMLARIAGQLMNAEVDDVNTLAMTKFVARMNAVAAQYGMINVFFADAVGHPRNRMVGQDVGLMASKFFSDAFLLECARLTTVNISVFKNSAPDRTIVCEKLFDPNKVKQPDGSWLTVHGFKEHDASIYSVNGTTYSVIMRWKSGGTIDRISAIVNAESDDRMRVNLRQLINYELARYSIS